jgi:hypothetical protein
MSATSVQRPAPVADLDWDSARMRSLAERAVELYGEFLDGLDDMRIARDVPADRVRDAVVRPVPAEGLSDEQLIDHVRDVLIEWGVQCGHPRFLAYVTGVGRQHERRRVAAVPVRERDRAGADGVVP